MNVAYLLAPGKIELRVEAVPEPDPGEVVVRVRAALTDGTDLKAFRRGHPKMPMPTRFGHEFSGDVVAVGRGVKNFVVGDRIASVHSAPCGTCYWCSVAEEQLCETLVDRLLLGAYAEYVRVPARIVEVNAYRIPEGLTYEAAAFLEPLACVLHAWDGVVVRRDMSVVIHGMGGFGLLHAIVARAFGVESPMIIGRNALAIARARTFDVGEIIDATTVDPRAVVLERTNGRGADVVVECTGAVDIWEAAPRYARRGGTVVLFGGLPSGTKVRFDAGTLHYDEVKIQSPFHLTPRAVQRAYELLASGQLDPRPLITGSYPLSELNEAFTKLDSGSEIKLKIVP